MSALTRRQLRLIRAIVAMPRVRADVIRHWHGDCEYKLSLEPPK